jgi:23S rRNA pseudouridine1911/1915/1917 synthase
MTYKSSQNKNKRSNQKLVLPMIQIIKEIRVHGQWQLLDFLIKENSSMSRNKIKGLLTRHQVLVDGAVISQYDFILHEGDIVTISKRPISQNSSVSLPPIIYEDDEIIVIDKPQGLLSIASDKEKTTTVYRLLTDYVQKQNKHNRIYIVHRLDKETSGVMMVVKNNHIKNLLQDNWNDIVTKRGYYAIVTGTLKKKQDTIRSWLKQTKSNLMYSSNKPGDGQEAITHYRVIEEIKDFSLLDIKIDTGRKNQIRVHLKDIGHQVIGDEKYDANINPLGRLGLHAYELSLKHPQNGKHLQFKSKIPLAFKSFFANSSKKGSE